MKRWITALICMLLLGGAAMVYWIPVHRYGVTCTRAQQIYCALERETFSGVKTWQSPLGTEVVATVRIQPRRRGSERVLLYLNSGSQAVFAAEFEGGAAIADAEAAAKQLNQVFSSAGPASVNIEARPPPYLLWGIWGGLAFLGLLVLVTYREMNKPERRLHS